MLVLIPTITLTVAIALLTAALTGGTDAAGILLAADLVTGAGLGGALLVARSRTTRGS